MTLPADPKRFQSACLWLLLALAALSLAAHVNLSVLEGVHEARVLETAREMLQRDDWVVPHYIGERRLEKPPLPYWLSAASYVLAGGPSVVAARLAVALLGLLMLAATWSIARAVADRRTALLVLPVMASLLLFNTEFRKVTTDPYLAAFTTAAIACFAWAFRRAGAAGRRRLLLAYLCTALALLSKGPIALPFILIGAFCVRPPKQEAVRHGWHWHALGAALALAPVLAWAGMVMLRLPDAFDLWRYEIWGRVTGEVEEFRGRWFYLPVLLSACSPLLLPFLAGFGRSLRQRQALAIWFVADLAFLMLLSSRKAAYLLPLMAPAALIAADYLARLEAFREGRWLARAQLLVNLALTVALLGAAWHWRAHMSWGALPFGLMLVAAAAVLARRAFAERPPVAALAVSGVLITTCYNGVLQTHLPEDRTTYNLSVYLKAHMPADAAFYQQVDIDPRLAFYVNRLPSHIKDAQLQAVTSPAWLVRHAPLPEALRGGWTEVLQLESRKGKVFHVYRR